MPYVQTTIKLRWPCLCALRPTLEQADVQEHASKHAPIPPFPLHPSAVPPALINQQPTGTSLSIPQQPVGRPINRLVSGL